MKPSSDASLVDRLDELVQNGRAWLVSETTLLKAKAEFAAKTYIVAAALLIVAAILCGTALVFLALSAVVALTPHVGLAGAYALTALGGLSLAALLSWYAYSSVTNLSVTAQTPRRRKKS
jgi:FtsH-binding integral membrane protein